MVRWNQRLNGRESEQTSGDGEGRRSVCCGLWGHRVGHGSGALAGSYTATGGLTHASFQEILRNKPSLPRGCGADTGKDMGLVLRRRVM